jgi:hypothetical protein
MSKLPVNFDGFYSEQGAAKGHEHGSFGGRKRGLMIGVMDHDFISTRLSYLFSQMHRRAITHGAFRVLEGDQGPLLMIDCDGYHLIWIERGQEMSRQSFAKAEDVIFQILADSAFAAGVAYEFANRIEGPDVRRMIHAKQQKLFARLDAEWGRQLAIEIAANLREHPYVDAEAATP